MKGSRHTGDSLASRGNILQLTSDLLARLPGLGPRSARRLVLHLLENGDNSLLPLIESLQKLRSDIRRCSICYNLDISDPCEICCRTDRDISQLCVVEQVSDLWALERGRIYRGTYHVLGGVLSAMEGVTPEDLRLPELLNRCRNSEHLQEVILATNLTIEGQTTAHYIGDMLHSLNLRVTRLAHGVPAGGELDYLDDGTLSAALSARHDF